METRGWKTVIRADESPFNIQAKEIWNYRDLCLVFIRKNFVTKYKQTVLGPLYTILSPLATSGIFSVIFGIIAGLSTNGTPQLLFYMAGSLAWNMFTGCIFENNNTFLHNAYIMGKVYFPRLVIPIANTISKTISMFMQLALFYIVYLVIYLCGGALSPTIGLVFLPFVMLMLGLMGFGIGLIFSVLNINYRDFNVILGFATGLFMYVSPVIYSLVDVSGKWRTLLLLNPVAPFIELFRFCAFGYGVINWWSMGFAVAVTIAVFVAGVILFNKAQRDFIDTV